MHKESGMKLAHWSDVGGLPAEGMSFMRDSDALPESLQQITIVLDRGTEARACELLARGTERVLLGDAALLDSAVVGRLVQQYGSERVGVWLPVKKTLVSWVMDCVSNEDFNCLTPSVGKPGWDVLMSDGASTGTDAGWWVGEMLALGASMALISVDVQDDADLNICAELMEGYGEHLWFSPWQEPNADLEPWVRYGQIRKLVLPTPNERDDEEIARICAAAISEDESVGDKILAREQGDEAII